VKRRHRKNEIIPTKPAKIGETFQNGRTPRRGAGAEISGYPPCVTGPIGLAQRALEELAGSVARQRGDEIDRARPLEAGELVAAPFDQGRLAQGCTLAPDHDGFDSLAPFRI